MHEYSIVAALVEQVEIAAVPRAIVRRVHVKLGENAGVDPALLRTAFETFRARTICDGAELSLTEVATTWRCGRCDCPIARGAPLQCPTCGQPARMAGGDEIILERIEMEIPDV